MCVVFKKITVFLKFNLVRAFMNEHERFHFDSNNRSNTFLNFPSSTNNLLVSKLLVLFNYLCYFKSNDFKRIVRFVIISKYYKNR